MKRTILAIIIILTASTACAVTPDVWRTWKDYMAARPAASTPAAVGDKIPILQNGSVRKISPSDLGITGGKASAGEVTTGTDDAKYTTPKAIKDAGIRALTAGTDYATPAAVAAKLDTANPTFTGTMTGPAWTSNAANGAHLLQCSNTGAMTTTGWGATQTGTFCWDSALAKFRYWTGSAVADMVPTTSGLSASGTPTVHQWPVWVTADTIKGATVTAGKPVCTDSNGEPAACTNLTDVVPLVAGGALGTPSSATLTNATGLPVGTGVSGLGTGVATALAATLGTAGGATTTIAAGTSALGTGAIASGTCATVVTTTATNTATTDVVNWGFNGDPTGVTGYVPSVNGMLTIIAYPSANNVNYKVCNNTAGSVTPGAITLNWRVQR